MTWTISKTFAFSAAHWIDGLPDDHQCARLHGHNYTVELILASNQLDAVGMVVDYGELAAFEATLKQMWDHRTLNDCPPFKQGLATTAERIAEAVYNSIRLDWPAWPLVAVRVSETPRTWAEYRR